MYDALSSMSLLIIWFISGRVYNTRVIPKWIDNTETDCVVRIWTLCLSIVWEIEWHCIGLVFGYHMPEKEIRLIAIAMTELNEREK